MSIRHDDVTLAVCIRCAQFFPARTACPFCADIHVSVLEDPEYESGVAWAFEVRERQGSDSKRVAVIHGFDTPADAHARAYEFLRAYVAERIAAGGAAPDDGSSSPS